MSYITGKTIKELRERRRLTQKELAEKINVSDKTVSKWETDKGLPDIGIIEDLAEALGTSIAELLTGDYRENENQAANMRKTHFYRIDTASNNIQTCCNQALVSRLYRNSYIPYLYHND